MSWSMGNALRRSLVAGLLSALMFGAPAPAQVPAVAALLRHAEALQTRLVAWRNTVKEATFNEQLPPDLSLDTKRGNCLFWIKATDVQITSLKRKPTPEMEVGLLSRLTLLDNALSNLGHALELARVTPPLEDQGEVEEVAQEKQLKSLRDELQEFYNEVSGETFQQLRADTQGSQAEAGSASREPGEISGHIYRADTGKPLADVAVTLESPASPQGDKVKQAAVDGSYEFAGLAPGIYWAIAYRKGFVGSVYGVGASQDASKGLISVVSGQKRQDINFTLNPVPDIIKLSGKAPPGVPPEGTVASGAGIMRLVEGNSHFTITAWYGQLAMSNPDGKDPYVIATGGNELYSFVFDPARSNVFYPVPGRYYGAIVSFNLNTRQYQTTPLPFSEGLKLLDVKQGQHSTSASYTVDGPCVPKALANGEDPWILPNHSSPVSQPPSMCLMRIPNAGSD